MPSPVHKRKAQFIQRTVSTVLFVLADVGERERTSIQPIMRVFLVTVLLTSCLALSSCWGCGLKQDPDQLRKSTAERTAEAKTDAKAIAQGIREGLARDDRIDINIASNKELETLPGITPALATRIVRNRPYEDPHQLVTKQVLSQPEYDKISSRLKAKK